MKNIKWTPEHENILIEWADKAICFRWLHAASHANYSRSNAWFTIPVIIMSTLTGTANFAQERFSEDIKPYIAMAIGGVNIFAGILTTIAQYLKISELNEAHRVSSIAWGKFYRNIKVELAKSPIERSPVTQMLKKSKEDYDLLMETSPAISEKVTKKFKQTFELGGSKRGWCNNKQINKEFLESIQTAQLTAYESIKKPEICGVLESTRNSVYKPKEPIYQTNLTMSAIPPARKNVAIKERQRKIETFIANFKNQRGREPTNLEIQDELQSSDTETSPKQTPSKKNATPDNQSENKQTDNITINIK